MRVKCNLLSHKRVDVTLQVTIDMLSEKGTKVFFYRTLRKRKQTVCSYKSIQQEQIIDFLNTLYILNV